METTKTLEEIDKLIQEYKEIETIISNKEKIFVLFDNSLINTLFTLQDYKSVFLELGIKNLNERRKEILNILEEHNITEHKIEPLK